MTVGADPSVPGDGRAPSAPRLSLLSNPFAVLGATPLTPVGELAAMAQGAGTREAEAACRTLSVPRTRLGAELAFLPGAASQAEGTLGALRRGERPEMDGLDGPATANVLAHLCAAGRATPEDEAALVALQGAPAASELAALLDADRAVAGVPRVQAAAMAAEQEVLAERQAAALLESCVAGGDPAGRLAALVRGAGGGAPSAFLRKAAAGWARHSATALASVEARASASRVALLASRDAGHVAALCRDVEAWAALTAPQRASDGRAGLDHPASLRALAPWRQAGITVAEGGLPEVALPLARTLAAAFVELPGEATRLGEDVRACAQLVEDATLEAVLAPLRTLADGLGAAPAGLEAALTERRLGLHRRPYGVARVPFGPAAAGVAGELWRAFDAACAAAVQSDAPWTIVRALAERIGGAHRPQGAPAALALHAGLVARAERSGREALAARLRAEERGLQRAAALRICREYRSRRTGALPDALPGAPKTRWVAASEILGAVRTLRDLTDDPFERDALVAEEAVLRRQARLGRAQAAGLVAVVAGLILAAYLDRAYTADPPYGHARARSLVVAQLPAGDDAPPAPAPAPVPAMPFQAVPVPVPAIPGTAPDAILEPPAEPGRLARALAPSRPGPGGAAPAAPDMAPDGAAAASLAFPARAGASEPRDPGRVYALAEIRWCVFNEARLQGAADAATDAQQAGVEDLRSRWDTLCGQYRGHRLDLERAVRERGRVLARLHAEGAAMLTGAAR